MQGCDSVYGDLSGGKMPLRGVYHLHGAKRAAGGCISYGFSEENGNRAEAVQDGNSCQNGRTQHRLFQDGGAERRREGGSLFLFHGSKDRAEGAGILLADLYQ